MAQKNPCHPLSEQNLPLTVAVCFFFLTLGLGLSVIGLRKFYPSAQKAEILQQVPVSYPVSPTPNPVANPISWKTNTVSLEAQDFYIIAGGQRYLGQPGPLSIHSDPGDATYTTLEVTWNENGREMRMYMYFRADGQKWSMYEMRTYNGQVPGDWFYYGSALWENIPLGQTLNIGEVRHPADMDYNKGEIYFKNLRLQSFLNQTTCKTEGQVFSGLESPRPVCCPGLQEISWAEVGSGGTCVSTTNDPRVCVKKCGDSQCTQGENSCNCLGDCVISPSVSPSPIPSPSPVFCPEDVNNDGKVDIQDLLKILSKWGSCSGYP